MKSTADANQSITYTKCSVIYSSIAQTSAKRRKEKELGPLLYSANLNLIHINYLLDKVYLYFFQMVTEI